MSLWQKLTRRSQQPEKPAVSQHGRPDRQTPSASKRSVDSSQIALERIITIEPHMRAPGQPKNHSFAEYAALSPDGATLATRRYYDGSLFVVDVNTNKVVSSFKPSAYGRFQFTPSGKELAIGEERSVILYETQAWQKVQQTSEVPANVSRFGVSPDGSLLAIPYSGGVLIWSFREASAVAQRSFPSDGQSQCFMAWSRDSALLATTCRKEGTVWSNGEWGQTYSWKGPVANGMQYDVMAVDFTVDKLLIAGDQLGCLSVIDIRSGAVRQLSSPGRLSGLRDRCGTRRVDRRRRSRQWVS